LNSANIFLILPIKITPLSPDRWGDENNKQENTMATYIELKAQAEKLLQQAEELRLKERAEVIAEIQEKINAFELTASDLGLARAASGVGRKARKSAAKAGPAAVKYRSAQGETWSGGRGRKPNWVLEVVNSGGDIEKFRVAAD
jgi:DNA-binding protein H-NS